MITKLFYFARVLVVISLVLGVDVLALVRVLSLVITRVQFLRDSLIFLDDDQCCEFTFSLYAPSRLLLRILCLNGN